MELISRMRQRHSSLLRHMRSSTLSGYLTVLPRQGEEYSNGWFRLPRKCLRSSWPASDRLPDLCYPKRTLPPRCIRLVRKPEAVTVLRCSDTNLGGWHCKTKQPKLSNRFNKLNYTTWTLSQDWRWRLFVKWLFVPLNGPSRAKNQCTHDEQGRIFAHLHITTSSLAQFDDYFL